MISIQFTEFCQRIKASITTYPEPSILDLKYPRELSAIINFFMGFANMSVADFLELFIAKFYIFIEIVSTYSSLIWFFISSIFLIFVNATKISSKIGIKIRYKTSLILLRINNPCE